MARGNEELMHDCFPKHSLMGTARIKYEKETDEEVKKKGASMERSKAGTKKKVVTTYHYLMKIIIIYHDFLPTPRRGSHVKSGKTHTQSSRYTP